MAYYKPKKGVRNGVPTITVPRTLTQCTYLNVPLAEMLSSIGADRVTFLVNKETKVIQIVKEAEGYKGYKILRTGRRGWGVTPKLRKLLPAGRYQLVEGSAMEFARA